MLALLSAAYNTAVAPSVLGAGTILVPNSRVTARLRVTAPPFASRAMILTSEQSRH